MLRNDINTLLIKIIVILILSLTGIKSALTQSISTHAMHQQSNPETQELALVPKPKTKPNVHMPSRTIHRVGTMIGARNSISVKSTDAGIIHRHPPGATCINCGVIDYINLPGQGPGLNAIATGVVAGTIARSIGQYGAHPHASGHPGAAAHNNHYDVGITMQDGSQAIITLPDASQFHRGDAVQLIDGVLVPHH
jgi:hypothetical protein